MSSPVVVAPDVELTLDRVEALYGTRLAADAELFVLAAHYADLHPPESLRRGPSGRVLRGMERAVRLGGAGTPLVAEFAGLELGARMQMGTWSARRYLADALDVRHRLPLCWQRVLASCDGASRDGAGRDGAGRVRVPFVREVASRTRHLSTEAAAVVDAAMADHVDGSLPWGRFAARLEGKVVVADPEVAAEREAARATEQFAKRTRSAGDGTAGFYVRSSVGVIARLDASVAFVAEALAAFGDTDAVDVRRVKALLVLANPTQAVQLLAAYAAQRARTLDVPLPSDLAEPAEPAASPESAEPRGRGDRADAAEPPSSAEGDRDDRDASAAGDGDGDGDESTDGDSDRGDSDRGDDDRDRGGEASPGTALDRMDAFARRVGFTPRRLPPWLTVHDTSCPDNDPDNDPDESQDHGPDHGQDGSGRGGGGGDVDWPEFRFDWTKLLPTVTLNLHIADETVTRDPTSTGENGSGLGAVTGVVRWDGEGPVTTRYVRDHLAPYHPFVIQPVIDLPGLRPVDAYELPDRHRRAVRLRTPADAAPFSANLTPAVDADHTEAYDPALAAGPEKNWSTRLGNLAPLGRFAHRLKTHGHWTMRQPFTGIIMWRDPHGQVYLVDHTGTHKITRPGHPARATTPHDPDIDIYPTDNLIEIDFQT